MVDVGDKPVSEREAMARAVVRMRPQTLRLIRGGKIAKGEVLAVARVAGIMAAKRTAEWIPMCHPLPLSVVKVDLDFEGNDAVVIEARVKVSGRTGVEMEALTAVSAAALTVYDMCKAVDRAMRIESVRLARKSGGKSGDIVLE
jgi:cyclic pyranopterin phosphate synthase